MHIINWNSKHSKCLSMLYVDVNLHVFGISSESSIFILIRWYVDEIWDEMRTLRRISYEIRQIPGGNNSFWQAWKSQHVIFAKLILVRLIVCKKLALSLCGRWTELRFRSTGRLKKNVREDNYSCEGTHSECMRLWDMNYLSRIRVQLGNAIYTWC